MRSLILFLFRSWINNMQHPQKGFESVTRHKSSGPVTMVKCFCSPIPVVCWGLDNSSIYQQSDKLSHIIGISFFPRPITVRILSSLLDNIYMTICVSVFSNVLKNIIGKKEIEKSTALVILPRNRASTYMRSYI